MHIRFQFSSVDSYGSNIFNKLTPGMTSLIHENHSTGSDLFLAVPNTACGILVPQSGIEPATSLLGAQNLTHWTTREVPGPDFDFNLHFPDN